MNRYGITADISLAPANDTLTWVPLSAWRHPLREIRELRCVQRRPLPHEVEALIANYAACYCDHPSLPARTPPSR